MQIVRRAAIAAAIAAVTVALLPLAASPASAKATPPLIVRDLPAQVRLVPGEKVRIVLSTNVTTGYSWHATGGCCTKDDKNVAKVSAGTYHAPASTNGMVGVPGTTSWTVTALRPGTTDVTIVSRPPGQDSTMDDTEVGTLHVIVAKNAQ